MVPDWGKASLGEIIHFEYGSGLPESQRDGNGFPVYGSNGIIGYHSSSLVQGPGIIIGRKGSVGCVNWSDKSFWPIDTTYYVRPLKEINLKWIYYLLEKLKLSRLNTSTGIPGLNRDITHSLKIYIPPLPEQQKIAAILSTWDTAIEQVQKLIDAKTRLKKGLMQQLLTGKRRFGEFVGKEWEISQIGKIGRVYSGGTPDTGDKENWNGQYCWVTPSEITRLSSRFIHNTERKITNRGLNNSSASLLPSYSIMICTRATIGECAINTVPMATNQGFKNIVLYESYNIDFIYYALEYNKAQLYRYAYGSTFLEVPKKDFQKILLPIPEFKEQTKIANLISACEDEIELLNKKLEILQRQKKGLMQVLLTGKVRVNV